ncbi:MAG: SCO family protein [Chloroflexaceae bacterium]|nr:SCO family protein [Chloroflexaceae bacterium]
MTDHNGQPFHIADQRGKVVLLFFGYTHCPDVCLSALSDLAKVRRELGRDAAHVRVAFVSVDPDRDVPTLLGRYVTAFDPTFVGLRGSQVELEPIYKAYRVQVVRTELPNSAFKYAMDHSMFIYVIDQAGRLRERFVHGATIEDMTNDVRHLVRTGGA